MSEQTAFGYGFFNTIAMCVPWSGRPLPPELTIAYKACLPPMNSNIVMVDTHAKPIDQARNYFAEIALQQKAKYMFFWDEDVLLPAHALRELIYVAENWRDIAVVAGIYCLKVEHPQPMVFKKPGEGVYWDWRVGEVFECYATGLGCALIRVEALNDIEKPWFKSVDNMDRHLDAVPLTEQWTEDLYFAKKIMDGKKWKWIAHGGLVMPHVDVRNGRHYELPPDSKPMRHLAIEVGRKKILDVGSGGNPINTDEGRVVTVDARGDMNPDYRCDIRRLPMASEEYDIVWSSHCLEHFSRAEAEPTLAEWVRVLKPDGELRLLLPNLEWAAKRLLEFSDDPLAVMQALDVFYAQQSYDLDYHKNGFTPKLIEALLRKLGFKHIILDTPDYHIYIRAWKIKPKGFEQFKKANDPFLTRNVPARAYPTQLVGKPKLNGKRKRQKAA